MPQATPFRHRDARTGMVLGGFFLVLALPVFLGTFFAEVAIDRVINLGAGALMVLVGVAFVVRGVYLGRRGESGEAGSETESA